ncbi:hypothetical protein HD554DRAFT_2038742 [Boletus coccyginus]|nr:hypothetical protein HD554DRAFT_2038742 [Boletus coccyginus]
MSGPPDGKYLIVLAGNLVPPPFPVGANEQGPTSPVIVEGRDNVWTTTKLDHGNYTLILKQKGPCWLRQAGENKELRDFWPTRAWTLDNTAPGTKVTLKVYELPRSGQLWNFIPVLED